MNHNFEYNLLRVLLRPLRRENIEDLRILRNKEASYFLNSAFISSTDQNKWFDNYLKKKDDIMFAVFKADNPQVFIGAIAAYNIDYANKTCEVGRTIIDKEKAPEKGIGTDATKAVCAFCFNVLKVDKIVGVVLKDNARILKVDERVGFKIVGENDERSLLLEMKKDDLVI